MLRRRMLAAGGLGIAISFGGCLDDLDGSGAAPPDDSSTETGASEDDGPGNETDDNDDSDGAPVLTDYTVSDHVVTPDVEHVSDMDAWGVFVATRKVATAYFDGTDDTDAEAVRAFVEETDFDGGDRLLYVQAYAPQTCYELRLDGEPAVSTAGIPHVSLEVNRTAPPDQPCADAITRVEILLRLSFDPEEPDPDDVSVTVSGHRDYPEKLRLEAER